MKTNTSNEIYQRLLELKQNGGEGVLATVIEKDGSTPAEPGAKMIVYPDGGQIGSVGGGTLEVIAAKDAQAVMNDGKSTIAKYDLSDDGIIVDTGQTGMMCGGSVSIFYEYIASAKRIYLFGGGHVGKALVYHLKNSALHLIVIDHRDGIEGTIDGANKVVIKDYRDFLKDDKMQEDSFFVIMTPSHRYDYEVLKGIYEADIKPAYIGLLASKGKSQKFVKKLIEEFSEKPDLSILYTPVGLDIGGNSIDEIAISIAAEIQAISYGKTEQMHLSRA